ncbi:MAG: tetratricopeptide repeat protein [Anaerolineales bacterium]|nr:tetratricopeptide repeat protein [Anaerolineales bacterium]
MGDYSQAQEYCITALAIIQATGHRWQEINVWILLGVLYQELGELTTAQTSLHQGLEVARQIGDEAGQNYLESNLGLVLRDRGDLAAAEQLFSRRLKLYEAEQNEYEMSFYLSYLSTVSLQAGQSRQAIAQAEQALALRQKLALRLNTPDDLAVLAKAYLLAGDQVRAVEYARQTLAILTECNGEGPEFSTRDYFYCYQVLAAVGESMAAQSALQAAYALVISRAGMITDPALRQSFLECVVINREIVTACTLSNQ